MNYEYQINFTDSGTVPFSAGKVVCVGRNYADHAGELNNPVPSEPLLFIKTTTSLASLSEPLHIPGNQGECHYETELALLIGDRLRRASEEEALEAVVGVGLALDLTLRDLQNALKSKGHPWDKAKAFDGACPVSPFVSHTAISDFNNINFQMALNGNVVQAGNSGDMVFKIPYLLSYVSRFFTLVPGDIVLTGTPSGVGPLSAGDKIDAEIPGLLKVETSVANCDRVIG